MNYTAHLSGKVPQTLTINEINSTQALAGTGEVTGLNLIFISEARTVSDTQRVSAMNVNGVIPVLYTPSNTPSQDYYYAEDNTDISSTYGSYHKIHEAHIPYLHGQLINHGLLPFNVYKTIDQQLDINNSNGERNDSEVVSSWNARNLINNVGRVLTFTSDRHLVLLGYKVTEDTLETEVLSECQFTDDSDPINDWADEYQA